jgi:hypothetical protein
MSRGAGGSTETVVKDIRRRTRRWFSAEEKIRIGIEGPGGRQGLRRYPPAPSVSTALSRNAPP